MKKNGGILDQVIWAERTEVKEDLAFLDKIIESDTDYTRILIQPGHGYSTAYDSIEDDVLYVKIDTDIVCFACCVLVDASHPITEIWYAPAARQSLLTVRIGVYRGFYDC